MRFGKNGKYIIHKHTIRKILIGVVAVISAICIFAAVKAAAADPADAYPMEAVTGYNARLNYVDQTYTPIPLDNVAAEGEKLGIVPLSPYVPEGFTLSAAELVEKEEESGGRSFVPAIRVTYTDSDNKNRFFTIFVSSAFRMPCVGITVQDNLPFDGESIDGRFCTFGGKDLVVYKFGGQNAMFAKFSTENPDSAYWLIHFEGLSKRDVRLVLTSVITQRADAEQ